MDFDAENNSIFENIKNDSMTNPTELNVPDLPQEESLLGNFINGIKNKVNEKKKAKAEEKFHNDLTEMFEKNTETMLILKSFGCKMTLRNINLMEIRSDELNIVGFMKLENGNAEPDEECKKLFEIIKENGVDSIIGLIACVIMGATETTLYTIAVYTSAVKIKNTRHILIASLMADITGIIMSIIICNKLFG